jgi:hypothetical protein
VRTLSQYIGSIPLMDAAHDADEDKQLAALATARAIFTSCRGFHADDLNELALSVTRIADKVSKEPHARSYRREFSSALESDNSPALRVLAHVATMGLTAAMEGANASLQAFSESHKPEKNSNAALDFLISIVERFGENGMEEATVLAIMRLADCWDPWESKTLRKLNEAIFRNADNLAYDSARSVLDLERVPRSSRNTDPLDGELRGESTP